MAGLGPTPVVLQVVDPPRRERARVLGLVAGSPDGGGLATALVEGAVIDAEIHATVVGVLRQCGDAVGKSIGIGAQVAVWVASGGRPSGVEVDVAVSGVAHPRGHHGVDGVPHGSLGQHDARVPRIPPHRRRPRCRGFRCRRGAGGQHANAQEHAAQSTHAAIVTPVPGSVGRDLPPSECRNSADLRPPPHTANRH